MALGWITVLQSVPWSEVIKNAPKVAEGAKKLWKAVGNKPVLPEPVVVEGEVVLASESKMINTLETRITAMDAQLSDLHSQMLASSELIKALADQNTELIRRIEVIRLRMLWLTMATVIVALGTAIAVAGFYLLGHFGR